VLPSRLSANLKLTRFQEIDANNNDITHFVGKIITLSQVVFEELIACHKVGHNSQELSNIEEDLSELETFVMV